MLPNFIGIGAPKSGTTWLFKCLQEHPEIFLTPIKETYFFDYFFDPDHISKYDENFENSDLFKAIGEVTATYIFSKEAPERIHKLLPDIKIIVLLRNPVDQVYSHYWHLLRQNFHSSDCRRLSFEQAIEQYRDRLIEPALYSKHLDVWLRYFDKMQLKFIFYDDIQENPKQVLQDLYSFLEVDPGFIPEGMLHRDASSRKGVSPRNSLLSQSHSFMYQTLNQYIYAPLKQLIGDHRSASIKDALKVRQIMQLLFYKDGYPKMNVETRQKLSQYFREDIQSLEYLSNRSLSHWI